MNRPARQVVVTGAGGFIGGRLVAALLDDSAFADARFVFNDMRIGGRADPRVTVVQGDFADPAVRDALLQDAPDLVFHLAGVLGGAAEADHAAARRVNLDGTLSLIEALRSETSPPRLVQCSSIAVFGPPLPPLIDDDTPPFPTMVYGAQKRMIEVAIEQFSARGWIDGIALRLPGVVARAGADARLKSAFLNHLFHAVAAGENVTLPVSPNGTTWLISIAACIASLIHAGQLPADRLGRQRAITLPAQRVAFADLVAALQRHFPHTRSIIDYAPDAAIEEQFGRQPELATPCADAFGFVHDNDLRTLIERAFTGAA